MSVWKHYEVGVAVNNWQLATCLTSVLSTLKQYTLLQIKTHNPLVQSYANRKR